MSKSEQLWMKTVVAAVKGYTSENKSYYDVSTYATKIADEVVKEYENKFCD